MGKDQKQTFNQKQFEGEKGRILLELQKSYAGDNRFKINQKFEGDVEVEKLSKKFKDVTAKEVLTKRLIKKQQSQQINQFDSQRDKQFSILKEVLPGIIKPIHKHIVKAPSSTLIINRFDPTTLKSQKLLQKIESEKRKKQIQQITKEKKLKKKEVKIEKGIDRKKMQIQKANHLLNELKRNQELIEDQKNNKTFTFKVNGSREQAFKASDFKLF